MQEKNIITQTKKEFQSMLSTFSHEIRNPLALITREMQMLSDSQPQLCFNEHWDNIMENLNYIRELLDELSRYQNAGHITIVQTNLSICLDRITSSFRPALDYLGISFETDIPR
ncbi:sensor histidine kinase, partial [Blautia schinkii]|uniref:histidine kinase dimerization/phospho-acceptor domain-containing protein n=1 Tax=Blautia schinkii TaxID=180164 RepID=UPI002ED4A235|nr:sensor histidine kinase [Blautia schinkii]